MPARMLFARHGMESLFRRVTEPVWSVGNEPPPSLVAEFHDAIVRLGMPAWLADPFLRAFEGDPEAQAKIAGMSGWEAAWLAQSGAEPSWFVLMIEQGAELAVAGREVDRLAGVQDFERIPDLVRSNLVLAPYMNRTALQHIGCAASQETRVGAMMGGVCEFLLSQVARVDAHPSIEPVKEQGRRFVEMMADREGERCVPGQGFVNWMMQRYQVCSLAEFWKLAPDDSEGCKPVGYNTLQGWRSGATVPNRTKAERFVGSVVQRRGLNEADLQREWRVFDLQMWATTRLEAVLRLVKYLGAVKPQPGMPSGLDLLEASGPDEWCRRRYGFWLKHWTEKQTPV